MEDLKHLKRWRPMRVGFGYALLGVLLLLAADLAFGVMGAPPWALRLLGVSLFTAFPFVLILSWALSAQPAQGAKPRPWELES